MKSIIQLAAAIALATQATCLAATMRLNTGAVSQKIDSSTLVQTPPFGPTYALTTTYAETLPSDPVISQAFLTLHIQQSAINGSAAYYLPPDPLEHFGPQSDSYTGIQVALSDGVTASYPEVPYYFWPVLTAGFWRSNPHADDRDFNLRLTNLPGYSYPMDPLSGQTYTVTSPSLIELLSNATAPLGQRAWTVGMVAGGRDWTFAGAELELIIDQGPQTPEPLMLGWIAAAALLLRRTR